ncbi:DUF2768 family protein [Cohnella sp. CFH 77786]|uniref:DUF2768 family protein n=1 Tax=Cohnella sp. CFH 77786 TaxID=2662265 RepID=UPI001C608A3D|nr:DUF2768 family protein [Cohnella sp. CFH 77786]MBW5446654.1 DUF2768 family protein [Cohnella sp. CFH 77786]
MDPMTKMWVSFVGIGLMVMAAALITFTRLKTKGWIRFVLSVAAFVMLLSGMLCGLVAIV